MIYNVKKQRHKSEQTSTDFGKIVNMGSHNGIWILLWGLVGLAFVDFLIYR